MELAKNSQALVGTPTTLHLLPAKFLHLFTQVSTHDSAFLFLFPFSFAFALSFAFSFTFDLPLPLPQVTEPSFAWRLPTSCILFNRLHVVLKKVSSSSTLTPTG